MQNQYDSRYATAAPKGMVSVYYDPKTGQYMQQAPSSGTSLTGLPWGAGGTPRYVPITTTAGQTAYTPKPPVNFNNLPQITPTGAGISSGQPYVRPAPQAPQYTPQFDPTFIQQMMAQRFGNTQPNAGLPAVSGPPTLTPGAQQSYGGIQGQGGLAALRGIAGGTPIASE